MDARTPPRATNLDEQAYFANRFLWLNALLQNLGDPAKRNTCLVEMVYQQINPSNSDVWFQESEARVQKSSALHPKLAFITDAQPKGEMNIDLSEFPANYLTSNNLSTLSSNINKQTPVVGLVFDEDEAAKLADDQLTALSQLVSQSKITKIHGLKKIPVEKRTGIETALAKNCQEAVRRQSITAIPKLAQSGSARLMQLPGEKALPEEKQAAKILNSTGLRP